MLPLVTDAAQLEKLLALVSDSVQLDKLLGLVSDAAQLDKLLANDELLSLVDNDVTKLENLCNNITKLENSVNSVGNSLSRLESFLIDLKANIKDRFDHHVKVRDFNTPRKDGKIGGAHDVTVFNQYIIDDGQAILSDSIKVFNRDRHPSIPGVKVIEYQIPKLDNQNNPMDGFKKE